MSNVNNRINDIRTKIGRVKENLGGKIKHPLSILIVLSKIETTLEDQLFELQSKVSFSNRF